MSRVRVGAFPPFGQSGGQDHSRATLGLMATGGIDHVCVGDHVSFFVGAGSDALITASWVLAAQAELPVYVGLYLLALRHPVLAARQLATIAQLAPGRLTLGVGIGGEDRHEIEVCGVDPRTRGRRMDECLRVVRSLAGGTSVTFDGEFFALRDALILPAPSPPVPLIVGGRSDAAVSRAARLGDGWLGIWVSPRRFASVVEQIAEQAASAGREPRAFEHGLNVWCGFAAARDAAREHLADQMQRFYQMPFEPFERYSPFGSPEQVAEFLHPYVEAGCSVFNVIPCASDPETALGAVSELRALIGERSGPILRAAARAQCRAAAQGRVWGRALDPEQGSMSAISGHTVVIERRFHGPPGSGHGGYTCGLLARELDGAVQVSLRSPPPLDRPLAIERDGDESLLLCDGTTIVAKAQPTALDLDPPPPPSFHDAQEASRRCMGFVHHPFPTCFACGPNRAAGEGLRLFPGPVEGHGPVEDHGLVACTWRPDRGLADGDGAVRPEFVWAALDCPTAFACDLDGHPIVLAQLAGRLDRPIRANEPLVITAWRTGCEGRKQHSACAISTPDGETVAASKALWIALREPKGFGAAAKHPRGN